MGYSESLGGWMRKLCSCFVTGLDMLVTKDKERSVVIR